MKKIIITLSVLGFLGGSITSVFAGYFNTTPVNRCDTQITRTLQIGSENREVSILQNMLKQGGYLYVTPNGYFGPSTKAAVKRFQNANGISSTGVVGELTRNAINERLCDIDVRGEGVYYDVFGYSSNTTYVSDYDPYVKVISPKVTNPAIYATPQENISSFSQNSSSNNSSQVLLPLNTQNTNTTLGLYQNTQYTSLTPVTSEIIGTSVINNPSFGYTYAISQKTGSITVNSPVTNAKYAEGDTVHVVWATKDLNADGFQILFENTHTGKSRQLAVIKGNTFSFVLTKELLDVMCVGQCNDTQQDAFKIVIATPVTDIAGVTTMFRAAISPITVKRYSVASSILQVSTSKTPVDSGERFRLYIQTPSVLNNTTNLSSSVIKVRAICINTVEVSIGGVPCGQELVMPAETVIMQQGVPVMITNNTWYKQDITFEVSMFNQVGQMTASSKTTVTANHAPLSW